jgi:hypothetical protein
MDEFKELTEAKALIAAFQRSNGFSGGDVSGILTAVRKKIDDYIRRKNEQRPI